MATLETKLAIALVEKYHAGQTYGPVPYTVHLNAVRNSVADATKDDRLEVIAILHDILEDTACTAAILSALFEDNIVEAVMALTKRVGEPRSDYLARVKANPLAWVVKRHDALCNLAESLKRGDQKRVRKYSQLLIDLSE